MSGPVTLCECFARDGLQHEPGFVPTAAKIALIDASTAAGVPASNHGAASQLDRLTTRRHRHTSRGATMRSLLALLFFLFGTLHAAGMQITPDSDQLVLSGPVVGGDLARIRAALDATPGITTVILRDSPGGDARTGYKVGELLRARRLRTAVSGYCVSSCSRMFLGGIERAFTDDLPPNRTFVGFHGHYDQAGDLMPGYVRELGLAAWIMRFTDGKADPALVNRWINIGRATGMASFYPPAAAALGHSAATLCDAPAGSRLPLTCETLTTDARTMGITTTDALLHSNTPPPSPRSSGWAGLADVGRLPTTSERVRAQYLAFLASPVPRVFALSADGKHFAWRAGLGEIMTEVLGACARAAGQPCALYAVDDTVVWNAN